MENKNGNANEVVENKMSEMSILDTLVERSTALSVNGKASNTSLLNDAMAKATNNAVRAKRTIEKNNFRAAALIAAAAGAHEESQKLATIFLEYDLGRR